MQAEKNRVLSPFRDAKHKHKTCLQAAMQSAKKHCDSRGARLTPIRRRVLELIWSSHKPVKAYDLLDQLKQEHAGSTPPTVYRALDFLQAEGIVHKLETLNAYIGCGEPDNQHVGQFLICRYCFSVAEMECKDVSQLISTSTEKLGFTVEQEKIELVGCCDQCRTKKNTSDQ